MNIFLSYTSADRVQVRAEQGGYGFLAFLLANAWDEAKRITGEDEEVVSRNDRNL